MATPIMSLKLSKKKLFPYMATPRMRLKLLVDKKGQKVLFAEANKDFVDFLLHIFSLPLGTVVELLGSKQMVGCLAKLKDSIQASFPQTHLQSGVEKDDIFNPKTPFNGNSFLFPYNNATSAADTSGDDECKEIYRCSNASGNCIYCKRQSCRQFASSYAGAVCPGCNGVMNVKMTRVLSAAADGRKKESGGFVKGVVSYMVMDDLVVKPMSLISSITLITKFGLKDLSQLEEKTVSFGKDKGLKLLKAALTTDKVLTSIFLH